MAENHKFKYCKDKKQKLAKVVLLAILTYKTTNSAYTHSTFQGLSKKPSPQIINGSN